MRAHRADQRREPEPAATGLRGEEGIKDSGERLRAHAAASVGDLQADLRARFQAAVHDEGGAERVIEHDNPRPDHDLSLAGRQCIRRVRQQVHHDLPQSRRVPVYRGEGGVEIERDPGPRGERGAKQGVRLLDDLRELHGVGH